MFISLMRQSFGFTGIQVQLSLRSALYILMVVGLAIQVSFSAIPAYAQSSDPLQAAQSALQQGNYKSTISFINKALSQSGKKPDYMAKALLVRGVAYQRSGKSARAIADFSNAQWLGRLSQADTMTLLTERANAYQAVGQKALAEKDLAAALKSGGNNKRPKSTSNTARSTNRTTTASSTNRQTSGAAPTVATRQKAANNNTATPFGGGLFSGITNFFSGNTTQTAATTPQTSSQVQRKPLTTATTVRSNQTSPKTTVTAPANTNAQNQRIVSRNTNTVTSAQKAETIKAKAIQQQALRQQQKQKTTQLAQAPNTTTNQQTVTVSEFINQNKKSSSPSNSGSNNILTNNPVSQFFNSFFSGGQNQQPVQTAALPKNQPIELHRNQAISTSALPKAQPKRTTTKPQTAPKSATRKKTNVVKTARRTPSNQLRKTIVPNSSQAERQQSTNQTGLYHLQLASFKDPKAADAFVRKLESQNGQLVGNKVPLVVETDLGQSGRHYRVFLGPYANKSQTLSSCQKIKSKGMDCFIAQ